MTPEGKCTAQQLVAKRVFFHLSTFTSLGEIFGCLMTLRLKTFLEYVCWFKQNVFIHRNHKLSEQVQETQKQYAYLSVTYR